uniref:CTCHY-type domain-containing protein n=1 Tax=Meloidogyne hapla TaxID=6305 RepID=A0A1I8BBL9_MELHA
MSMIDYKVTYINHKEYSKINKSTVRIFTNISNKLFKLPKEEGYYFCEFCERFIFKENKHCFKCGYCTSLDGSFYKHCNYCNKCVKRKYIHCKKCFKCHLKERCFIF